MMKSMMLLHLTTSGRDDGHRSAYLNRGADQGTDQDTQEPGHPVLRALSLASLLIGATALGLYIGRELRQRYKFKRRTPYDFYSKAGDPVAITEYGMGV
jgi:hypothetical protein